MKLTKVFRQKDNSILFSSLTPFYEIDTFPEFIEMLASMRTGVLEDWHKEEFQKLCRQIDYDDGISPTLLYVTRIHPKVSPLSIVRPDSPSNPRWRNTTLHASAN